MHHPFDGVPFAKANDNEGLCKFVTDDALGERMCSFFGVCLLGC